MRHTLIDPAAAYTFTGLLPKLFSLLAVLSPLSTDLLTSVREEFNPTYTSPFILWLMVFLSTCRWALHVHNGWSSFAVPQVAAGRSTPLGPHCKWAAGHWITGNGCLFPAPPFLVSQGPAAVASRICITPVMGRRVRSRGESQLQAARIALTPPQQIPPTHSLIAVSSKLPQETGCEGEALGLRSCFSLF